MTATLKSAVLAALQATEEYRKARESHFPSPGSFEWYVRIHRAKLIECGALLKHRGIWHVHADRFDQAVLEIAQASSKTSAA